MTELCTGPAVAYDDEFCAADAPWRTPARPAQEAAGTADTDATRLMDLFRRTGSEEVFEQLVKLTTCQLMRRVRRRVRFAGDHLDPQELLQDAYVNIFRYPDRFDPSRPAAFRAWATTIVDNTVRRHLRRARSGVEVSLRPMEVLSLEADAHARAPEAAMMEGESAAALGRAFALFLALYLNAYQQLSEREQFVLQMVEVRGLRYAEIGGVLRIRAEAVKMVVFRARRRIFERMNRQLMQAG
jgi:RNA polymerase sigma factor (sigma-70 family)